MKITISGLQAYGYFMVTVGREALIVACFDRSKTKVRGIAANLGSTQLKWGWKPYTTSGEWKSAFFPQVMDRDKFTFCLAVNQRIGVEYMATILETEMEDLYNYYMVNYKMPLKKEWVPAITQRLEQTGKLRKITPGLYQEYGATCPTVLLNDRDIPLDKLYFYHFDGIDEEMFEETVCNLIKGGVIKISDKVIRPLEINGLEDYFNRYGCRAVDVLDKALEPLTDLKSNVNNLAIKSKSLFPQQAATVEGIKAMKNHGIKYAVLNHGMGCGKTLESACAAESIMVEEWLKKHPDKTLKDAYEKDGIINYRVIVMAPGHLLEKWKQEVEEEIPYAKATIIHDIADLVPIREQGMHATGKEFFIISKDCCKLSTQSAPIPTMVKKKVLSAHICKECKTEHEKIVYKKGVGANAVCPSCKGKDFEVVPLPWLGRHSALTCPWCGELLMKYKGIDPNDPSFADAPGAHLLQPEDFANGTTANSKCYFCDGPLWGVNAKPLTSPGMKVKEPRWYKISHYRNYAKKTTTTAFVLKGYEDRYLATQVAAENYKKCANDYGPRKVAPAHYIKHYLKGYFDFCILDEAHKYLGESAQSVAAHALIKASKFTMALTGTISNGTALCFFNLFYMLEPKRLLDMGFRYTSEDKTRFCKEFGCVETEYFAGDADSVSHNSMSRGRQKSSPKVKPGISPVLFGKLLMDRCLFMDISDLSQFLPKFSEQVITVNPPIDVYRSYRQTLNELSEASQNGTGMAALSSMLQFGLSYLDKPYDRDPIMDPYQKDALLAQVFNFDEYREQLLPKEQRLVDLVNQEINEGRNVFVYAAFTGNVDANISYRLKDIIEKHCNLRGRVEIIQSTSPAANKREEWFHKKASEGIKVFITNPKNVETGLDFCFNYNGANYNFPTLIFYQITYELATIWQASRRAFRLSQKEECRNYYLAYDGTLQTEALSIMAKKQVATAAIQGHFSAEGLASMAQGVDARTLLAESLSRGDTTSGETLAGMFDALNAANNNESDEGSVSFTPSLTFYQLIGTKAEETAMEAANNFDNFFDEFSFMEMEVEQPAITSKEIPVEAETAFSFDSLFDDLFSDMVITMQSSNEEVTVAMSSFETIGKSKKKTARVCEGQQFLF